MEKNILNEYIDACELVKETEHEINKIKRKKKTIVMDHVKGSNPDYPYQARNFHMAGGIFTYADDKQLRLWEHVLVQRKTKAEEVKINVEEFMNTIPMRMQRIIKYKYFEGLSWEQVADRIGRKATGDSVRMEMERFLKEK